MADKYTRHVIANLSGGRNPTDAPLALGDTQVVDAVNVDWYQTKGARRRGGMAAEATTFEAGGPFTGRMSSLFRFVPTSDDALAQMIAIDDASPPIAGWASLTHAFNQLTFVDPPVGNGWDFTAATINNKLILAYNSGVNRLHYYDGVTSTVKRMGIAASVAPTGANTGSGSYAATLRYYRQRFVTQVGGVTIKRSEPSPSLAFTPSGSGTGVVVTRAALVNEGETHWEVEVSLDNVTFYRLSTVAVGTTTYTDSAATTTYSANPLSAITGTYQLQKSYKYVATDQNRVLGLGSWTSTDKQARLEISAVVGSSDVSDDERVDTTINYYMDFDDPDGGIATGLAGPIFGAFFAFKDRQFVQLTPTGSTASPYRQEAISKTVGAITHLAIIRGEDADGNPCLYWMSRAGPYRWGVRGLEYIGKGIDDYIIGPTDYIFLDAPKIVARTLFYPKPRQVLFWWASRIQATDTPALGGIYDITAGGWSRISTGDELANVRCACLFGDLSGTVHILGSAGRELRPYVGQSFAVNRLRSFGMLGNDDAGTAFQAYIVTKALEPGGPGMNGSVGDVVIVTTVDANIPLQVQTIADYGEQSVVGSITLAGAVGATRVSKRVEGTGLSGVQVVQYLVGDVHVSSAGQWTFDRLVIPMKPQEPVSA